MNPDFLDRVSDLEYFVKDPRCLFTLPYIDDDISGLSPAVVSRDDIGDSDLLPSEELFDFGDLRRRLALIQVCTPPSFLVKNSVINAILAEIDCIPVVVEIGRKVLPGFDGLLNPFRDRFFSFIDVNVKVPDSDSMPSDDVSFFVAVCVQKLAKAFPIGHRANLIYASNVLTADGEPGDFNHADVLKQIYESLMAGGVFVMSNLWNDFEPAHFEQAGFEVLFHYSEGSANAVFVVRKV